MITCKKCGAELSDDFIFCNQCGTKINIKQTAHTAVNSDKKDTSTASMKSTLTTASLAAQKTSSFTGLYIFDFIKRVFHQSNFPTLIYFVLNVLLISLIISLPFDGLSKGYVSFIPAGLAAYGISLLIALSPIGEFLLRIQTGCKVIEKKEHIDILEPLFREVYEKAKLANPAIPDNVRLYINPDDSPNAFATGRQTICVTEGMLSMPDGMIKGALAHEFGHLANKDTDMILVVTVGNLIVSGLLTVVRIVIQIFYLFAMMCAKLAGGIGGFVAEIAGNICRTLIFVFVDGGTWAWSSLGTLLVMKSSRDHEYGADKFACDLSPQYGNDICALLECIDNTKPDGLFASLASSHPNKAKRIEKMQSYPGVTYPNE